MRHLLLSFFSPEPRSDRGVRTGDATNDGASQSTAPTITDERDFFETQWLRTVTRATSINLLLALSGCAGTQVTSRFPTEFRDASPSGWLVKESAPRVIFEETEEVSILAQSEENELLQEVISKTLDSGSDDVVETEGERFPTEPLPESQGATLNDDGNTRNGRESAPTHYYLYDEGIYRVHPTALTIDPMAVIHP